MISKFRIYLCLYLAITIFSGFIYFTDHLNLSDVGHSNYILSQADSDIPWPTNEWTFSDAKSENMNETILDEMESYIDTHITALDSIIIIRNDKIVQEKYYNNYNHNQYHHIWSCTKSVTSLLIGIAFQQGYLSSLDQKVLDFFSNHEFENVDDRKENMTLRHLLTMTTGINWTEDLDILAEMQLSIDPVGFMLNRSMIAEPGTVFQYNTGVSHLLSRILHITTGKTPLVFANEFLFNPLGILINDIYWEVDRDNIQLGGTKLYLRPRDMAKIGLLCLHNGTWNDQQIVHKDWVLETTKTQFIYYDQGQETHYGYHWWIQYDIHGYCAFGHLGQLIFNVPDKNLIIVTTSTGHYPFDLIYDYILPAVLEDTEDNSILGYELITFLSISTLFTIGLIYIYKKRLT